MTDISVTTLSTYRGENRQWLANSHGTGPSETLGITLDVSKFTEGTHYPDGFVASGTVLGKVTATGLYGPYDDAASDGRQTAVGFLFGSLVLKDKTKVSGGLVLHAFVNSAKLPTNHGLDANGRTDLKYIIFTG